MSITIKYLPKLTDELIKPSIYILNEGLGNGFITQDTIKQYNNDNAISFLAAFCREQIIGLSVFCLGGKSEIAPHLLKNDFPAIKELEGKMIAFHLHIAVDKLHRNKGAAQQMIAKSMDLFQSKADVVISTAWAESKVIEHLYIKNGFRKIAEISDFWYADSIEKQYTCPVCGAPPCHCKAKLFIYSY